MSKKGSVTVFFVLIFLIILSLAGSVLELARINTMNVCSERSLYYGTDSVFSYYHSALFSHYNLLFLQENNLSGEAVSDYINPSINPNYDNGIKFFDLYRFWVENVSVKEAFYATDNNGEQVKKQILDTMLYQLGTDAISDIVKRKDLTENNEKAKKIEQNVQDEKKSASYGEKYLELIKCIDGVSISSNGCEGQKYFVKMFSPDEVSAREVSILHDEIWNKVKDTIYNPVEVLENGNVDEIKRCAEDIIHVEELTNKAIQLAGEIGNGSQLLPITSEEMIQLLEDNRKLLENIKLKTTKLLTLDNKSDDYSSLKNELKDLWKNYKVKEIRFDYSTLNMKSINKNPIKAMKDLISKGILSLVLNEKSISKNQITDSDYYMDLFSEKSEGNKKENYKDKITGFISDEYNISGILSDASQNVKEDFLIEKYIQKYFSDFRNKVDTENWNHALNYEKEYILSGNDSDQGNLEDIMNRILLFRMVPNVIYLYTDTEKCNTAYMAALGIVGMTGIEPLVRFTKTLILLTWAFDESLLDATAIFQGKDISVVKTKDTFRMKFADLFQITHEFLQNKAKGIGNASGLKMGYSDFLTIFLAGTNQTKKIYRIMDLIQENINLNTNNSFSFVDSIYSAEVTADFNMSRMFLNLLPFTKTKQTQSVLYSF